MLGFNLIKDIIIIWEGKFINLDSLQIPRNKKVKLNRLWDMLPVLSRKIISENENNVVVPFPQTCINMGESYKFLKDIKSHEIYKLLVNNKVRMPKGMHRWINRYNLSEERVKNGFTFAHKCTLSTKSIVFQYKIATYTLPTREYLWNYQIYDNYYCHRCLNSTNNYNLERDNIKHNLFSCSILAPFLSNIFDFFIKRV